MRRLLRRVLLAVLPRLLVVAVIVVVLLSLPASVEVPEPKVLPVVSTTKDLFDIDLKLTPVERVPRPTAMAVRYGDDALYVASKKGHVWRLQRGPNKVVLDIHDEISFGFEQGLLGLAFTPDGDHLVVNFTNKADASVTRIYEFGDVADESTGHDIFTVPKPKEEHNAGNLAFGPDGYLYLSLGDGGLSGDPDGNAQSLESMLGKIHRIDVHPDGTYDIPPDNPFAGEDDVRPEIWAYGFRNPWRYSFDRLTGDLWIADVGRDKREEVSFEPWESSGGNNYGWNKMEGTLPYQDAEPPEEHVLPVHDYEHGDIACAVTGGYVYRGSRIAGLDGTYLFSDFCRGGIDALRLREVVDDQTGASSIDVDEYRHYGDADGVRISSFGQDADGELYVLALEAGGIYRIDPA